MGSLHEGLFQLSFKIWLQIYEVKNVETAKGEHSKQRNEIGK